MPEVIRAEDLSVCYSGSSPAIAGVNLSISAGEKVLLLGPSGAGKSTLLATLAGIVGNVTAAHVSGRVDVAGCNPQQMPLAQYAHHVATLFQDPADQLCLPTVIDEVNFSLENRGVRAEEIEPRSLDNLATFGAGELAARRTHELSGGQGQRVALAAATVAGTEVLLLDEPTALLDSATVGEVGRVIAGLDAAVIVVEHRLDELGSLPRRTIVLGEDGKICADGPTEEVLRDPEIARLGIWLPAAIEVGHVLGRRLDESDLPGALEELAQPAQPAQPVRPAQPARSCAPLAKATNASVHRGASCAVSGLNFTLEAGQITAVIGVNGSGKSTLLRGLASLLPTSGLRLNASAGMVFQNPEHQFLTRTAADEIRYGLAAQVEDAETLIAKVLERFALAGRGRENPYRLSGGQQRRLSLAAMAVMGHGLCLLDEPTFGQSRSTAIGLANHMRDLAAAGRGVVFASHDLRLVARYADQVLVLANGKQLACGPTGEMLTDAVLNPAGLILPTIVRAWPADFASLRSLLSRLDNAVMGERVHA